VQLHNQLALDTSS